MQHVEAPRPMQPPVPLTAAEEYATLGELLGDVAQTLDFSPPSLLNIGDLCDFLPPAPMHEPCLEDVVDQFEYFLPGLLN